MLTKAMPPLSEDQVLNGVADKASSGGAVDLQGVATQGIPWACNAEHFTSE